MVVIVVTIVPIPPFPTNQRLVSRQEESSAELKSDPLQKKSKVWTWTCRATTPSSSTRSLLRSFPKGSKYHYGYSVDIWAPRVYTIPLVGPLGFVGLSV